MDRVNIIQGLDLNSAPEPMRSAGMALLEGHTDRVTFLCECARIHYDAHDLQWMRLDHGNQLMPEEPSEYGASEELTLKPMPAQGRSMGEAERGEFEARCSEVKEHNAKLKAEYQQKVAACHADRQSSYQFLWRAEKALCFSDLEGSPEHSEVCEVLATYRGWDARWDMRAWQAETMDDLERIMGERRDD